MNRFKNELKPYKCLVFDPGREAVHVVEYYATTKAHALSLYRKAGFIPNTTCKQSALFDYIISDDSPDKGNWSLKSIPPYARRTNAQWIPSMFHVKHITNNVSRETPK